MGLNQLDRPTFKRYRLVEEPDVPQNAQSATQTSEQVQASTTIPDNIKADINALRALYDKLKADVDKIKEGAEHGKSAYTKSQLTADASDTGADAANV